MKKIIVLPLLLASKVSLANAPLSNTHDCEATTQLAQAGTVLVLPGVQPGLPVVAMAKPETARAVIQLIDPVKVDRETLGETVVDDEMAGLIEMLGCWWARDLEGNGSNFTGPCWGRHMGGA